MKEVNRILIVEDKAADADLAKYTIQKVLEHCEFQIVETREDFLNALDGFQPDVILSDYSLPRFDGMKALKLTLEKAPLTPLIIWTGSISEDVAVECMKAGANNYILKENIKRLGSAVIHALEERQLLLERTQVEEKYQNIIENSLEGIFQSTPQGRYLNVNPAMARIYGYDSPGEMIDLVKSIANQIYVDSHRRSEFLRLLNSADVVENFEERNYRKDGNIIWISVSARVVRDAHGNILYYEGFIQDITQRKKAEEALQNSEKRFRALIENGLDNISLLKADGTLIWESPAAIRMLDYSQDEFVGRDIFSLMHPGDLTWTRGLYEKLIQEPGGHQRGTFRLRRSDGTWRWVDAIVTNMLNEPSVNAIVVNYRDVTEQKQAEEALRESQAKYRHLVETSHDLIWSVDAEGKITFLNQAAKEIYGYEPAELIGHSYFEIMDQEAHHQDVNIFREMIGKADEFREMETHVRHRDGREVILSANSIIMRANDGKVIGVTGSSHDITERKQMEEALRDERNLLRTLIDNVPDRIYAMDIQGRKTLSNTADWKACGGKRMDDVIGKTDFDTYPPALAEEFWKLDKAVLDSGQPVINFEEPGLDFEGNLVSILTTKIPLHDEKGNVIGLVGIGRDITERKQAEEALHKSEQLYRQAIEVAGAVPYYETYYDEGRLIKYEFIGEGIRQITGYGPEEFSAVLWDSLVEEVNLVGDLEGYSLEEGIQRVRNGNHSIWKCEHRIRSRDGKTHWVFEAAVELRDENGISYGSIGTYQDITERKQAEEKLRQSETRYRLAMKATNDVIWEWNPKTNQLLWSENAQHVFGYPPEEIGPDEIWWDNHIYPDDRERIIPKLNALIAGNQSIWKEEYRFLLKNGSYAHISDRGYVERDENSVPIRMIGAMSDITARKESEQERQALLEIMQGLARTTDLQELLELIHRSVAKVIYANNFFVVLYHEDSGLFEEIYSVDQYDPPAPPAKLEKSITSYVFRSGEPLLLTQESFDQLVAQGELELVGTNSASWLGVPLKTSGRTIGVMAVQDYENDNRYSERDKEFLSSIASQIALAITHRQAVEAVRESELRYRGLFENLVIGFALHEIVTDDTGQPVDYVFLEINPAFERLTGINAHETIGKRVKEILPGNEHERFIQIYGQVALTGVPVHFEEFSEQLGKYYEINAYSLKRGQFAVTFTDITERRQATERIRNAREFLQGVQNSLSAHIAILDQEGNIVQVNTAWRVFGEQNGLKYAEDEIGLNYLEVCDSATGPYADEAPLVAKAIRDVIAGHRNETSVEYPCHSPEQKRWFTLRITKFKDNEGTWVILAHENITERKWAEERIRAEREKAQNYLDIAGVMMLALDQEGIITLINQKGCEILGYSAQEITGKNWIKTFLPESDRSQAEGVFQQLMLGNFEPVGYYENSVLTKSGERRLIAWHNTVVRDGQGRIISTLSSGEDITERKRAEVAELEQRALAEALRDTAETLSSTLNYAEVLDHILAAVGRVVPHDAATIMLIDGESARVARAQGYAERGFDAAVMEIELPLAETTNLQEMLKTGKPTVVPHTQSYSGWRQLPSADWLLSNVGAPISIYGKVIGFILLDSQTPGFFTPIHAERLEAFANQAALAIHNAHLLQQAREEIAERKRAETALLESTIQFRTLFEASPDAILLIDPENWSIVDCNTATCQMNGYERRELIGQNIDILNVSLGDPYERATYLEKIRQQDVLHYETFHRHKTGKVFSVEVSTSLIKFGDRNLILGIDRDITERKQAEEEIRRRAVETSALLETSLALTTLDLNDTLQTVGNSAKTLFAADGCRVFLTEPDNQHLRCVLALQENFTAFSGLSIKIGEGVTGAVAISGRAEIVNEMQNDPRAMEVPGTQEKEEEAIMFAPLKERDRTIGVLSVRRTGKERPFQPADLELLEAFASMAASAVSNARLFEETQHQLSELHDSEERFRQLADNIQEVFWMTDAESGKEIYMSPAVEAIWGCSVENLMYEPNAFIDSIFPEDQPAVLQAIEKEKTGEKVEIEYRIVRPDGTVRWVWDRAFPIFDKTGKVKRIAGISADITERREAEIALVKSQSRYRELFDSSPVSIWEEDYSLVKKRIDLLLENGVTDLNEYLSTHPDEVLELASLVRITDANKASLELYGTERSKVILKGLAQVVSTDALNHFQEEILGFMSPSKRFTWEGTDNMMNGKQIEVIVNGSIPHGYQDNWSKVIVSVSNITDRKQAEQELRKLSRAVEQSASTIIITDTAGNIEYINPKFTEITGYSLGEVIGQNPRILKSGFISPEVYKQLWQTIASGKQWHGELLNKKKNNELYWENVTVSPILNEHGEITHFVGVKEDITQRKQSEVETQRHLTELEALYENGLAVGSLLTASEIGNRIINTFARYLEWHHVTIRLRREESDDLDLVAFNLPGLRDEERAATEQRFIARINKVGQGLSGWVIQTGIPVRTDNVHAYPHYVDVQDGIQSGLYMPLKVGERVIGVISVESEVPDAFTEQDERLLATLANQAAIAFENARLYETIQKELSERKRAEQALRTSEVHYRELADSITDILFELDQDLHYTHWNKASELVTGVSARDAIGKPMHETFGESEEQTRISQIYENVLKNRQSRTFETTFIISEQKRSFEVNAYPSTRGVSVVAKDVTERKRSEIIMQKRFELMEFSAHHSLGELMQKTLDEVSELTESSIGFLHFVEEDQIRLGMQTWSTRALQLFNVPISEGEHRPLDQAGVWAEAAHRRHPLIQNDYESLSKRKGLPEGHIPITRELVIPIIRNERIMAILGIANKSQDYTQYDLEIAARLADYAWDITERKQMELALQTERNQLAQRVDERTADLSRANSNLARALRVKDEFLANMSHELRTPLNAILGLSESLSEQIAGPLNEKQQKYIATISESGHHLLSLINDILDLAKIDAGQITLDINKVDIHSVCQASLRMIKQLAQKKNQEVSLEIDDGLGLMWADERRLKQMLVNLLGNAVKFTPENGRLGLEVHGDEEANKISFTVWDKGVGIKDEDLSRLFQPFVQLDSGLARETTGTGLGLALVAQMARLHGGSIHAISEPENGSRFTVILPWEPALAMDAATRMKITGKFRAIKPDEKNKPVILLVEDTQEVTMMIKDYLELAGYKVLTAQDGVDALVQAKLVRPDLILMDVQMPRMDGLEATRKLRSEPDFRYTPIIALTALAMPNDRERCLEAGMDEYISKPINLKALIKIIQSCLFNNQKVTSR